MNKFSKIIKNKYNLYIFSLIIILCNNTFMAMMQGMDPSQMSDAESAMIVQQILSEYEKLSPEEKNKLAQETGMPLNEIESAMNEMKAAVEEVISDGGKELDSPFSTQTNTSSYSPPNTATLDLSKQDTNKKILNKNELEIQIKKLNEALNVLYLLSNKLSNEDLNNIFIEKYNKIEWTVNISIYYFELIINFLKNNLENQDLKIESSDIKEAITMSEEIVSELKNKINGISNVFDAKTEISNENNLFFKYNIKNNNKEKLEKTIEEKITNIENEIKTIKKNNDLDKKTKTLLIQGHEETIKELESDLSKSQSEETVNNKKIIENHKKHRKIVIENITIVIEKIKNIIDPKGINILEKIINKYIPEEFKIGKKKDELYKKQLETEQRIKTQRGSSSFGMETERIASSQSYENNNYNQYSGNDYMGGYNNDAGNYSPNNNTEEPWSFGENKPNGGSGNGGNPSQKPNSTNTPSKKESKQNSTGEGESTKKEAKEKKKKDGDKKKQEEKDEEKETGAIDNIYVLLSKINTILSEIKNQPTITSEEIAKTITEFDKIIDPLNKNIEMLNFKDINKTYSSINPINSSILESQPIDKDEKASKEKSEKEKELIEEKFYKDKQLGKNINYKTAIHFIYDSLQKTLEDLTKANSKAESNKLSPIISSLNSTLDLLKEKITKIYNIAIKKNKKKNRRKKKKNKKDELSIKEEKIEIPNWCDWIERKKTNNNNENKEIIKPKIIPEITKKETPKKEESKDNEKTTSNQTNNKETQKNN
jgi:hypothetical protein